jgi:nucleotide-binding universal stress UspA family protein
MAQSLLVPLDMSHISEAALPFASWIAKGLGADVVLCCVVSEDEHTRESLAAAASHAATYLESVAGPLRDSGVTVWTQVATGKPADEIAEAANGESVRLVVLTTFGKGGDSRHLGGTASRLSRTLVKPALFVSASSDAQAPISGPLLVALDGSAAAEATLGPSLEVAEALRLPVVLVRVAPWARELFATFVGLAPPDADAEIELGSNTYLAAQAQSLETRIDAQYQTLRGQPAQALIDYAQVAGGMLAMGAHGHSGGHFWSLGGTTDKVLRGAPMPVLVVPVAKSVDGEVPAAADPSPVQAADAGAP